MVLLAGCWDLKMGQVGQPCSQNGACLGGLICDKSSNTCFDPNAEADTGSNVGADVGSNNGNDAGINTGDGGYDATFDGGACASEMPIVDCQDYGGKIGWQCIVQAGCFIMGDSKAMSVNEHPSHMVTVPEFKLDKYEVTTAQYKACVDAVGCTAAETHSGCNYNISGKENHPINCISWEQSKAYCAWAGKRLPTEAEWEKAARGIDERKYPWGNSELDCDHAVQNATSCGNSGTAPVGSKPAGASPYGVMDMIGNVWEFIEDDWHDGYTNAPSDGSAWIDVPRTSYRVMRGQSWKDTVVYFINSSSRTSSCSTCGGERNKGFRCARD
jgi:formylglycine-generating enzyme required for sulfatase activity